MKLQYLETDGNKSRIQKLGKLLYGGTAKLHELDWETSDPLEIAKKLAGGVELLPWESIILKVWC